jgi:hypothetical protein
VPARSLGLPSWTPRAFGIFVPRVTLGNAENYRMRLYNFPILLSFLFPIPAIPAEIVRIFPVQKQIIDAILPRNLAVFRGTETHKQSVVYVERGPDAREKHTVSTGTLGTKIKGRPMATYWWPRPTRRQSRMTARAPKGGSCVLS